MDAHNGRGEGSSRESSSPNSEELQGGRSTTPRRNVELEMNTSAAPKQGQALNKYLTSKIAIHCPKSDKSREEIWREDARRSLRLVQRWMLFHLALVTCADGTWLSPCIGRTEDDPEVRSSGSTGRSPDFPHHSWAELEGVRWGRMDSLTPGKGALACGFCCV